MPSINLTMTNDNGAMGAEHQEVDRNRQDVAVEEVVSHVNATGCKEKLNCHHNFHYIFRDISFTPQRCSLAHVLINSAKASSSGSESF